MWQQAESWYFEGKKLWASYYIVYLIMLGMGLAYAIRLRQSTVAVSEEYLPQITAVNMTIGNVFAFVRSDVFVGQSVGALSAAYRLCFPYLVFFSVVNGFSDRFASTGKTLEGCVKQGTPPGVCVNVTQRYVGDIVSNAPQDFRNAVPWCDFDNPFHQDFTLPSVSCDPLETYADRVNDFIFTTQSFYTWPEALFGGCFFLVVLTNGLDHCRDPKRAFYASDAAFLFCTLTFIVMEVLPLTMLKLAASDDIPSHLRRCKDIQSTMSPMTFFFDVGRAYLQLLDQREDTVALLSRDVGSILSSNSQRLFSSINTDCLPIQNQTLFIVCALHLYQIVIPTLALEFSNNIQATVQPVVANSSALIRASFIENLHGEIDRHKQRANIDIADTTAVFHFANHRQNLLLWLFIIAASVSFLASMAYYKMVNLEETGGYAPVSSGP